MLLCSLRLFDCVSTDVCFGSHQNRFSLSIARCCCLLPVYIRAIHQSSNTQPHTQTCTNIHTWSGEQNTHITDIRTTTTMFRSQQTHARIVTTCSLAQARAKQIDRLFAIHTFATEAHKHTNSDGKHFFSAPARVCCCCVCGQCKCIEHSRVYGRAWFWYFLFSTSEKWALRSFFYWMMQFDRCSLDGAGDAKWILSALNCFIHNCRLHECEAQ